MVPLEPEPSDGAPISARPSGERSAPAPLSLLSQFAFKDALLELEATVRKTRDASSAAVLQLWQVAEKQLGVEVDIEDPALRGLFGLHVVAVEELCSRVRAQAEVTISAVEMWSQPHLGLTAAGMRVLGDSEFGDGSSIGQTISEDLAKAEATAARQRQRLSSRIQTEVLDALGARLQRHSEIREIVRERQRWSGFAVAARRDVARFRKEPQSSSGSFGGALMGLGGQPTSQSPLEEAELRLEQASQRLAALDGRLLQGLEELRAESIAAVRRPWASLLQLQAEFFAGQQVAWGPLAEAFEDFAPPAVATSAPATATETT